MEDEMIPFELIHCGNSIMISDFHYNHEDAVFGNHNNTTFIITVKSGAFTGIGDCEYNIKEFVQFAKQINDLYEFRRNKVELMEIGYGSRVLFEMDKIGHLTISGEIIGYAGIHSLKFEFLADQTSLKPFANSLEQVSKCIS